VGGWADVSGASAGIHARHVHYQATDITTSCSFVNYTLATDLTRNRKPAWTERNDEFNQRIYSRMCNSTLVSKMHAKECQCFGSRHISNAFLSNCNVPYPTRHKERLSHGSNQM